jgi:hypothetical protein
MSSLLSSRRSVTGSSRLIASVALGACAVLGSPSAHAHIKLMAPTSWVVENTQGGPDQKTAPCGTAAGTTASDMVTTVHVGDKLSVTWQETVPHPGHFRIALAMDRADLFDPDVVTSDGTGTSGQSMSAEIMSPVGYPVLLDGLFPRDNVPTAQAAPFVQEVTIPDMPCEKCTLQVIQFMAQHGPGYFYHHCADLKILAADADLPGDVQVGAAGSASTGAAGSSSTSAAGSSATGAAGAPAPIAAGVTTPSTPDDDDDSGCSLGSRHAPTSPVRAATLAAAALGMVLVRRRSQR